MTESANSKVKRNSLSPLAPLGGDIQHVQEILILLLDLLCLQPLLRLLFR